MYVSLTRGLGMISRPWAFSGNFAGFFSLVGVERILDLLEPGFLLFQTRKHHDGRLRCDRLIGSAGPGRLLRNRVRACRGPQAFVVAAIVFEFIERPIDMDLGEA